MTSRINRRKFIESSTLGSAAMMLIPSIASAGSLLHPAASDSEILMAGITPVSVIDNACMLAFRTGRLSRPSQQVVTSDIHVRDIPGDKGRLAVVFPPRSSKLIDLLTAIKNKPELKYAKEKRAMAFGWAAINAVDKYINPDLKKLNEEDAVIVRMHQDSLLIHGFSWPEYNVSGASSDDMEKLLNAMLVRTTTRVHTLKPDSDDGIGWVNRITDWRKENVAKMKTFATIVVDPDETVAGKSFYNKEENIIVAANQLQKAQDIHPEKLANYLQDGGNSNYAKALVEATEHIFAIDSFLEGKISSDKLGQLLNLS